MKATSAFTEIHSLNPENTYSQINPTLNTVCFFSRAWMAEWSCPVFGLSPGLASPSSAPQVLSLHSSEPPGILSQLLKAKGCCDFASPCTAVLLLSISSFINNWICGTLQVN